VLSDTLIVIPSRLSSTRLPEKPLAKIHGYPMIYWVAQRIKNANICNYVVATDSSKIEAVCQKYDINVIMTSTHCKNGSERVAEVSKKLNYEYYCNVQGDEPLIDTNGVRDFIQQAKKYENTFVQAVTLAKKSENDLTEVKVAIDGSNRIRYLSRLAIPFDRGSVIEKKQKCLGLYLYDNSFISSYINLAEGCLEKIECVEQLRCIENNLDIRAIMVNFDSVSVDTVDDLNYVKSIELSKFQG
jgi:3-deoxy-manno-octulosonate cytidylyltransferase (CMP-KDO synthetase)